MSRNLKVRIGQDMDRQIRQLQKDMKEKYSVDISYPNASNLIANMNEQKKIKNGAKKQKGKKGTWMGFEFKI